jgi:hypothetical protein
MNEAKETIKDGRTCNCAWRSVGSELGRDGGGLLVTHTLTAHDFSTETCYYANQIFHAFDLLHALASSTTTHP